VSPTFCHAGSTVDDSDNDDSQYEEENTNIWCSVLEQWKIIRFLIKAESVKINSWKYDRSAQLQKCTVYIKENIFC
jgi:hypothetical protein